MLCFLIRKYTPFLMFASSRKKYKDDLVYLEACAVSSVNFNQLLLHLNNNKSLEGRGLINFKYFVMLNFQGPMINIFYFNLIP